MVASLTSRSATFANSREARELSLVQSRSSSVYFASGVISKRSTFRFFAISSAMFLVWPWAE